MLRHGPVGLLLGTAFEVAAIVFVVSVLPRVDLRPKTAAADDVIANSAPAAEPVISTAAWKLPTAMNQNHETSFSSRHSAEPTAAAQPSALSPRIEPPPLLSPEPTRPAYAEQRPAYVEQRLDRAS